jgi:4-hydroxy-tetrahydrodipicolinate synthase
MSGEARPANARFGWCSKRFAWVVEFDAGNPFTNANRVLDHRMAYGSAAGERELPLLYGGTRLPAKYIERADGFLRAAGLFPESAYAAE